MVVRRRFASLLSVLDVDGVPDFLEPGLAHASPRYFFAGGFASIEVAFIRYSAH
jgi:hypothetical protein